MEAPLTDHSAIQALTAEIQQLRDRVAALEHILAEDHQKLTRLETEVEHDHEVIGRLEHPSQSSYYTGRRTVTVGL
jgi:predicted  nucleic acid-binding Zn-ribbon protein